ncbi:MAG: beta-mannosidase [Prevotella sp.]|nr:beta-mannosidase [Prevotella sp.]
MKSRIICAVIALFVCVAHATAALSPEAQALLDYLKSINGKKMLSGTMANVDWNINEALWVHQHTGRWPALNCFDYIHHMRSKPGGELDYTNTQVVEDWHAAGGIVSIMWHWNVPARESGRYAFYSKDTDFDVRKIFEEDSPEYALMLKDIDLIASYLKLLKDKHIPVIWRPLHEAGGKWFWWGGDADACRRLWHVMYQRFAEAGLDNLIWAFTPAAAWQQPLTDGMRWYPGDEYVDIVGYDIYNVASGQACHDEQYQFLRQQCPDKLVALTECGNVATMSSQWEAGAKWLFFMPWYDYRRTRDLSSEAFSATEHQHGPVSWWQDAWAQDYVLSRDQVSY